MEQKVKDLIERAKETAVSAASAAGKAADSATKKAGGLVELTKQNFRIFDLNTDIELLFKEIGKLVYATHNGEEIEENEITERLNQIDAKSAEIAAIRERIAERKNVARCPDCGSPCDRDDTFCRRCGTAL